MSGHPDPYHQHPTGTDFTIKDSPNFLLEAGYLLHPPDDGTSGSAGSVLTKIYPGSYKFGGIYNGGKFPDPAGRVVYSKISDSFSNFGTLLGAPLLGSEKAIELNYSLQVTPYWYVQPVVQYYVDVGANGALPNAPV